MASLSFSNSSENHNSSPFHPCFYSFCLNSANISIILSVFSNSFLVSSLLSIFYYFFSSFFSYSKLSSFLFSLSTSIAIYFAFSSLILNYLNCILLPLMPIYFLNYSLLGFSGIFILNILANNHAYAVINNIHCESF